MTNEQQLVARFSAASGMNSPVEARLLDLLSELGEVAKEYLRATDYGRVPFQHPRSWEEEMGDVYYSLLTLANASGVDLGRALERVLRKYEHRMMRNGNPGSGR